MALFARTMDADCPQKGALIKGTVVDLDCSSTWGNYVVDLGNGYRGLLPYGFDEHYGGWLQFKPWLSPTVDVKVDHVGRGGRKIVLSRVVKKTTAQKPVPTSRHPQ